jgi:large subunit ribosomal protein L21
MYAIVRTGGKQYRVERGQRLLVERLAADEGAEVTLEPILYRGDQAVFDRDGLSEVTVTARVLGHVRGEKLRVFKFKPKRGYKRRTGHRQALTSIEVTEIAAGRRRGRAAEPAAEAPAPTRAPAKPKARKPAGAKAGAEGGAGQASGSSKGAAAAKPARRKPQSQGKAAGKEDAADGS